MFPSKMPFLNLMTLVPCVLLFIIWLNYSEEKLRRGSLLIFKSQMMILQVFAVYLQEIV